MKRQINLFFGYSYRDQRFKNIFFKGLRYLSFSIESQPTGFLEIELFGDFNREIYRTSEQPRKANALDFGAYLKFKPTTKLSLSILYNHYQLDELNHHGNIFNGYILRGAVDYLLNKKLYCRMDHPIQFILRKLPA